MNKKEAITRAKIMRELLETEMTELRRKIASGRANLSEQERRLQIIEEEYRDILQEGR